MSVIRIKEESPTLSVTFEDGANNRPLGKIGHPVQGKIDWKKTAETVKHQGDGLKIELIPR